jgi:hypothetical protein
LAVSPVPPDPMNTKIKKTPIPTSRIATNIYLNIDIVPVGIDGGERRSTPAS